MKKIIITSLEKGAGKTTVALALALKANKKFGYFKPIGDNPLYKEKKIIDYDAFLFREVFGMDTLPEEMCLGLHHSKILHFYPDAKEEFKKRMEKLNQGKELFIIEGGEYPWKGASLGLDVFSISKEVGGEIIFVVSGDYHNILDEITYISKTNVENLKGVILNMIDEFNEKIVEEIESKGVKFLGYLPEIKKLKAVKVSYIAEKLFAKVVAGENGLDNYVENVFIAALSAPEIKRHPDFKKKNKLIITGGDRADVIMACVENGTSGIILTNNIVPSANILARANEKGIPLLSVRPDTYTVAKLVENIQPVILPEEKDKLDEIEKEAENIKIEEILG